MARIKKPGLDYFPLDTQFVNNRTVRRIMKQQGDAALAVLINVYCAIYAGHGYYVEATDLFYEDLADNLYTMDTAGVRRTIRLALDYGLFHADLYREHGILTSEGIQRQYFFSVKRRSTVRIDPRFCLLPPDEAPAPAPEAAKESVAETPQSVTDKPQSATNKPINADLAYRGTHSIAQNSTAQSLLPPDSPPAPQVPQAAEAGGADPATGPARMKREYTQQDVDALVPPPDGVRRNLDGLRDNLRLWRVPPQEQYAIVLKSNFGAIGHPLWQGFYTLRASHGKIRQPGKFLLSLCCRRRE